MDRIVVDVQSGDVSIVPLTADEIAELAKPEPPEQIRNRRIGELKSLLASTDYKVLPDYDKPDPAVIAQRQAWRNEIRSLIAA
jgi:hypothetical protein